MYASIAIFDLSYNVGVFRKWLVRKRGGVNEKGKKITAYWRRLSKGRIV